MFNNFSKKIGILSFLAATGVFFVSAIFSTTCLADSLVPNADIELGTPSSWNTYNNNLTTSTGWVTDAAHAGSRSLKILNPAGKTAYWQGTTVTLASPYPKTVTFGGWSKADGVSVGATGRYHLRFFIVFEDSSSSYYYPDALVFTPGTHDWENKEITATFSKGVKKITPYCRLTDGAKGTVWFDDLYATPQGSTNKLLNPDMEAGSVANWTTYNNTLNNTTGWATDASHSPIRSLKIVNPYTTKYAKWSGSYINFTSPYPTTLSFGGWSKAEGVTVGSGLYGLQFYLKFTDNTTTYYTPNELKFTAGTHDWEYKLVTATFSKGIKQIVPYCLLTNGATGTVWFDDLFVGAPLACGTITPQTGIGIADQATDFVTTYFDPAAWDHIESAYLLINTGLQTDHGFYGYYNQDTNLLYLRSDSDDSWLGGYSPGSSNTIENSSARLDCSRTTVSGSGITLSITWNITFKASFLGAKQGFLYMRDATGLTDGWVKKGDFYVGRQPVAPPG